jgi:hypothetical protein
VLTGSGVVAEEERPAAVVPPSEPEPVKVVPAEKTEAKSPFDEVKADGSLILSKEQEDSEIAAIAAARGAVFKIGRIVKDPRGKVGATAGPKTKKSKRDNYFAVGTSDEP